jgi:hypothetical protein
MQSEQAEEGPQPFLWVTDVMPDSPAQEAGLLLGDGILMFGDIVEENAEAGEAKL